MSWLQKILNRNKKVEVKKDNSIINTPLSENIWKEFKNEKPPHKVVLAACYTYDCGWLIHTAWWYEEMECWMVTSSVQSERSHLSYTHWTKLPSPPNV